MQCYGNYHLRRSQYFCDVRIVVAFVVTKGEGRRGSTFELCNSLSEKVAEFRDKFANPYVAVDRGFVDEVIEPRQTRRKIIAGLDMTRNKRDRNPPKKHGNIPL